MQLFHSQFRRRDMDLLDDIAQCVPFPDGARPGPPARLLGEAGARADRRRDRGPLPGADTRKDDAVTEPKPIRDAVHFFGRFLA